MSDGVVGSPQFPSTFTRIPSKPQSWTRRLPRLVCSQNPFYLLSVCFVLHATAQWFHGGSGQAFSPWPLLALIAAYITLLASTGFVIVRFGGVWDDARSILLLILLLFVELSLIFDETLIRDRATGQQLLMAGLLFSMGLSELLLLGLRIRLPWMFRIPYHLMLSLLFLYPLLLVSPGARYSMGIVAWRILLFPVIAAGVLLLLIPAIRRGPEYTRTNGTPWSWPWYPWSLFVFLTVCIGFRAYALSLSFDPVFGGTLQDALRFDSAFGVYFLVPILLASGVLLLEIGLVNRRQGVLWIAMQVPLLCLYLSIPALSGSASYGAFVRQVTVQVGSPVWIALLAAAVFYGHALLRRVDAAHLLLILTLVAATRIGPGTSDLATLSAPQAWPLLAIALIELARGLSRWDSHAVTVALVFAVAALVPTLQAALSPWTATMAVTFLMITALLGIGACFRDEFAWLLRVVGAPLMVVAMLGGMVAATVRDLPSWSLPAFACGLMGLALVSAIVLRMRLYFLSAAINALLGMIAALAEIGMALVRETGWKGAQSFSIGIGWFLLAVFISAWKAGWLNDAGHWLRGMLTIDGTESEAT